jgi:hypothetical protein
MGFSDHYADIDGFAYYECRYCRSLHIDPAVLQSMDAGEEPLGNYADDYWERERTAAIDRADGPSLSRSGEAILYCRRPVERFLDIGTGPGYLIERLQALLYPSGGLIHGVEKFPPHYMVDCPNYHIGDVGDLDTIFDAGVCIEVIEHLTPRMLSGLARGLQKVSAEGSLWLFNTGMPDYVRQEDPGYLDPLRRGHVLSYSLKAIEAIFGPLGFGVTALPGKSYAFIVEFGSSTATDFNERIYQPHPSNEALLKRNGLLYQATFEAARSSYYFGEFLSRTAWALSLDEQVRALSQQLSDQVPSSETSG